jgi:hypothetical protein
MSSLVYPILELTVSAVNVPWQQDDAEQHDACFPADLAMEPYFSLTTLLIS